MTRRSGRSQEAQLAQIVAVHGAWSGGWAWKKLRRLLEQDGHTFWAPTLTGVGERNHLASPAVDLSTHVDDVVELLEFEDLTGVTLLAHSYGGLVATAAAARASERIDRMIYLDAFVPCDGDSLASLVGLGDNARQVFESSAGEGWRLPPRPMPTDTSPEDLAWAGPRRRAQPIETFLQPVSLPQPLGPIPRSYTTARGATPATAFAATTSARKTSQVGPRIR
jgi:pimeloyl-ACP methyl ester carboxylesterase